MQSGVSCLNFLTKTHASEGAAGLSCTELSIWEFPFLRGGAVGRGGIVYDVNGMPQKVTLDSAMYACMLVSY